MTVGIQGRFLVTAASLLVSVSLASAQELRGEGGPSERATSATAATTMSIDGNGQTGDQRVGGDQTAGRDGSYPDKAQQHSQVSGKGQHVTDRAARKIGIIPAEPGMHLGASMHLSGSEHSGSSVAALTLHLRPDDIRRVQRFLIERGLLHGKADGIVGPKTRHAIRGFQRQQGIQVSGRIDGRTASLLGVPGLLKQPANQNPSLSAPSPTSVQTSPTPNGQAGIGQGGTGHPQSSHQDITDQELERTPAKPASPLAQQHQPSATVGQSTSADELTATGQSGFRTQSENKPSVNGNGPSSGKISSAPSPTSLQTSPVPNGQAGIGQARTGHPQSSHQDITDRQLGQTTTRTASPLAQQHQSSTTVGQSTSTDELTTTGQGDSRTQSENRPAMNGNGPSHLFTDAAIAFILMALGAFILMPAI